MTRALQQSVLWTALALCAATGRAADFADEAFLEFLGSFDDGEGNWLDPTELMQADAAYRAARSEAQARDDDTDETENDDDEETDNR